MLSPWWRWRNLLRRQRKALKTLCKALINQSTLRCVCVCVCVSVCVCVCVCVCSVCHMVVKLCNIRVSKATVSNSECIICSWRVGNHRTTWEAWRMPKLLSAARRECAARRAMSASTASPLSCSWSIPLHLFAACCLCLLCSRAVLYLTIYEWPHVAFDSSLHAPVPYLHTSILSRVLTRISL